VNSGNRSLIVQINTILVDINMLVEDLVQRGWLDTAEEVLEFLLVMHRGTARNSICRCEGDGEERQDEDRIEQMSQSRHRAGLLLSVQRAFLERIGCWQMSFFSLHRQDLLVISLIHRAILSKRAFQVVNECRLDQQEEELS
jgi:hypothetical protein